VHFNPARKAEPRFHLAHEEPAVDLDDLAMNKAGLIAAKKYDRISNLLRRAASIMSMIPC